MNKAYMLFMRNENKSVEFPYAYIDGKGKYHQLVI